MELKNEIKDYDGDNPIRSELLKRLDDLLDFSIENQKQKIKPFHKRLRKHKYFILTFLFQEDVFPDNNASERAIRNLKIKLKISGQFITLRSAMDFAILILLFRLYKNG